MLLGSFSAGGSERAMINFANGLVGRGVTVDLIAGGKGGPFRSLVADNVNVIELNRGVLRSTPRVRKHLREHQPDILFASQAHVNLCAIASRFANNVPTKTVIRESTTPSVFAKTQMSKSQRFIVNLAKRFFRRADHVIAVGEDCRKDCIQYYRLKPGQITTVYSAFINDDFYRQAEEPIDHRWLAGGDRVISSMGRVMPVKDFVTLVKAFANVRQKVDCKLMIIGDTDRDPEYFAKVSHLVNESGLTDHVDFVGFHKNPFPFLAKSEVYVLSSDREGMPGALVQAMALGCKLVATDCKSGPREILKDGDRGALVPVGDVDAMTDAILSALENHHDRETGRTWAKEFDEESSIDMLMSVFERVKKAG